MIFGLELVQNEEISFRSLSVIGGDRTFYAAKKKKNHKLGFWLGCCDSLSETSETDFSQGLIDLNHTREITSEETVHLERFE